MTIISLLLSGILNGVAQIFWKMSTQNMDTTHGILIQLKGLAMNPYFLLGFLLYGISIIIWIMILSKTEVSFAYPFLAISFVIVLIGGRWLGEDINLFRYIGVFCIILGIIFISQS